MKRITFKWKVEKSYCTSYTLEVWSYKKTYGRGGKLIGIVSAQQVDDAFHLHSCSIKEEYRRRGIGTFMLRLVQDRFHSFPLYLECHWDKVPFYKQAGFDIAGWSSTHVDGICANLIQMIYYKGGKRLR